MNIGIVLAGGMNNGIYEIGCLKAIAECFPQEDIACISASSIGALVGYSFASGQLQLMTDTLKDLESERTRFAFLSFSRNSGLLNKIRNLACENAPLRYPTYITVWNYSKRKMEYIPFHTLTQQAAKNYLLASIAIPVVNKGIRINNDIYFDGGVVDNIPVYPMLEKNLDFIFCIYFDNRNYYFENDAFDRKVVKLCHFPVQKRYDLLVFDPDRIDPMIEYGYQYTKEIVSEILSKESREDMYSVIASFNRNNEKDRQYRVTADSAISSLNKVMERFAKRSIM